MSAATVREHAALYVGHGISVIPVPHGTKKPTLRDWPNLASKDFDQLNEWFAPGFRSNIGILTGPASNLLVVDVDVVKGGADGVVALQAAYGDLPATLRVNTGGGGYHLYYRLGFNGETRDRIRVDGFEGVDLKCAGQVIAPPSVHPSGQAYEFASEWAPETIVDAPGWLVALVKVGQAKSSQPSLGVGQVIGEGSRNSTLFSYARRLCLRGLKPEEVRVAVFAYNETACVPPLEEREVEALLKSALSYPSGDRYAETDLGNGRRLVSRLDGSARYDHASKAWYVFNDRFWARDQDGGVVRAAKDVADGLLVDAQGINDPDVRKGRVAFALKSQSLSRIMAAVEMAKSEPGVSVSSSDFDRQPFLLNARNGTIDLRTGTLAPHDRADLLSRAIDIDYDPAALCPVFEKFISETFEADAELIEFVQRLLGYAATAETREQLFFVFHGAGRNGKSTLLKAVSDVLGPYAAHTPTETLLVRHGAATNDLARLAGARFVTASEADASQKLNEAFVKQITGDEPVTARYLYGEFFTFLPVFKLVMATNAMPEMNGSDAALFRRLRLIPFNRIVPVEQQDQQLSAKLAAELPGILVWIVRGAVKWYGSGLNAPAAVMHASAEFRADSDTVGVYLDDRCEVSSGEVIRASHLFTDYRRYTEDGGRAPLNQTSFGRALTNRGIVAEKRGGASYRVGIKLRPLAA